MKRASLPESDIRQTYIGVGDFACVPVHGPVGVMIGIGEWLDGAFGPRLPAYDHALLYDGWWDRTPPGITPGAPTGRGHYVFEAQPGGARRRLLAGVDGQLYKPEQYKDALWSTDLFKVTAAQRTMIQSEVDSLVGTPYSALDYLALTAHRLHLPIPHLQHYIADTGHLICSQLVDMAWCRAGIHLFNDNRWPGYVTPWDLARVLMARQQY